MSRDQIEEMAKCCPYYDNGKCHPTTDETVECDLMCNMFGFMASLENAGYRKQGEIITLYDRIKAMTLDEMASFFVYLEQNQIITTADRYICQKCKSEHGGYCPMGDEKCLYDMSNKETIKYWLEGSAYGETKGGE